MSPSIFPSLKFCHWPERDQLLWQQAQQPAGLFDDDVRLAASWAPATRANCEKGYSVWLGYLEATGNLYSTVDPVERLTRDRVIQFVEAYSDGRSELTVASTLRDIAYVLRAFSPPNGIHWFTKYAHRTMNKARPSRPKLSRMARITDLVLVAKEVMEEGLGEMKHGRCRGAQKYRDGLLIGLLAARPLRRRNIAELRLGHTLRVDSKPAMIDIPGTQTKNGHPIRVALPIDLAEPLQVYLDLARPILLASTQKDDGWLWIGRRGNKMSPNDITIRVSKVTEARLGRAVSPHIFRDCVATEVAIEDPAHIGINKSLLGHASLQTSQKFYNQADSFTAFSQHHDVLRQLREEE